MPHCEKPLTKRTPPSIVAETPTKLRINDINEAERAALVEALSYVDKKVDYALRKLKSGSVWFIRNQGRAAYNARLADLQRERDKCLLFKDEKGYWTYTGVAKLVADTIDTPPPRIAYAMPEPKLIPWAKVPEKKLRGYQRAMIDKLVAAAPAGPAGVECATGVGKSFALLNIAKELALQTVVMAPSASIASQLYEEFVEAFGKAKVGLYGGSKKEFKKQFTIAIGASLTRLEDGSPAWNALSKAQVFLCDECLPYDAGVDVEGLGIRPIGAVVSRVKKGIQTKVLSYDEDNDAFVYRPVSNAAATPPKDLIKVTFTNSSMVTSWNHPYLTGRGYVRAEDLVVGDVVVGKNWPGAKTTSGGKRWSDDQLQIILGSYLGYGSIGVHGRKIRLRVIHGESQRQYAKWMAQMLDCDDLEEIPANGYAQKPAVRFCTSTFLPPFAFTTPKRVTKEMAQALDWRAIAVWYMDDGYHVLGTKYKNKRYDGYARFCTHSLTADEVDLLVARLKELGVACKAGVEKKDDGRQFIVINTSTRGFRVLCEKIAQYVHPEMAYKLGGRQVGGYSWGSYSGETADFAVTRIERKTFQRSSRRESLNHLYDIEVEGTNNFVAFSSRKAADRPSGVVVHNCHLAPAATLVKVCFGLVQNAPYRFFFTGTALRNDGLGLVLEGIMGPIVYSMSVQDGVDQGFLAKPVFKMVWMESSVECSSDDVNDLTRAHVFYNDAVNRTAAMLANKAVAVMGRPTLILIDELEQFSRLLPHLGYEARFAHGGITAENKALVPDKYHESDPSQLVKDFNDGQFPILVGTSCIATGTDIKAAAAIIYLRGGKSEIEVRQGAIGRGTRLVTGKTDCVIIDFGISNIGPLKRHAEARRAIYKSVYPSYSEIRL